MWRTGGVGATGAWPVVAPPAMTRQRRQSAACTGTQPGELCSSTCAIAPRSAAASARASATDANVGSRSWKTAVRTRPRRWRRVWRITKQVKSRPDEGQAIARSVRLRARLQSPAARSVRWEPTCRRSAITVVSRARPERACWECGEEHPHRRIRLGHDGRGTAAVLSHGRVTIVGRVRIQPELGSGFHDVRGEES